MTRMKGWRLTLAVSSSLLILFGALLAAYGSGEEGIRVVVRASARTSVLLFAMAFGASSLRALWQNDATKWLLANRRFLGASYAASHVFHAVALAALYPASAEFRDSLNAVLLVGGGGAYVFTLAMAFTSNDASVAALGRPRWQKLHTIGGWYIWAIFAQSYLPRAATTPAYIPVALLVLAIPAARLASHSRRRAAARA